MSDLIKLTHNVVWKDFEVKKNSVYLISGIIENLTKINDKSALIIYNFQDEKISKYDVKFNRISFSKKYGYYKYLPEKEGRSLFIFNIKIPSTVNKLSIGLVLLENASDISIENLTVSNNYIANNYMKKHMISSENNLVNYNKRVIFKARLLKEKQKNIIIKNTFSYMFSYLLLNSFKSFSSFIKLPQKLYKLFKDYLKHKRFQLNINRWRGLPSKAIKYDLKLENYNNIKIKGKYFSLAGEKNNAALVYYNFDEQVEKKQMIDLGFSYSEKIGYYHYINTSVEGEQSFSKEVTFPPDIKKVTLNFRRWHSLKPVLLKITTLKTLKVKKNKLKEIKNVEIYSDELSDKETLSMFGWEKYENEDNKPIVMAVMDEFTTGCFEDEVCLVRPRPDNWLALIKMYKPSFVFIESAWKGNNGSWQYRVANYSNKPGNEIEQISNYCKQKNIPIIFWNKEDPVHHQKFMCSAKLATHIFTTDSNMIASYKKHTGNKKAFALPFAAQPTLHKPKSIKNRLNKSCFAGSWYGNRHAERGESMKWLLEAANEYGLDIFDRNFGTGVFPFPEAYKDGIKGSLPYKELCTEYSRYKIFLNVNSVTESPTMFSRRVFELMACGTPIVSTYAKGIDELFETDAVWLVQNKEEALEAIQTLLSDKKEWRRRSLLGIREVFSRHTYTHRLNYIFDSIGLGNKIETTPEILLLAFASTTEELKRLNEFLTLQNYPNITLQIQCSKKNITNNMELHKNINLCDKITKNLDTKIEYKAIGWIDAKAVYGDFYIQDLVNAIVYEPNANGWAKSIENDYFEYNAQTKLNACIWNPSVFIEKYKNHTHDENIQDEKLFVIDSDEYTFTIYKEV